MRRHLEDYWPAYAIILATLIALLSVLILGTIASKEQRAEAEQFCARLGFDGAIYANRGGYDCYRYDGEEYIQIPIIVLMNSK